MKPFFALFLLGTFSAQILAQEPAEAPLPSAAPATGGTVAEPAPLIPEPPPLVPPSGTLSVPPSRGDLPSPEQSFQKSKTGAAISQVDQKVRYRQAKTRALKDEKLSAMKDEAYAAHTEREKRAGLKKYYNALFDRMLKIDGSVKPEIEKNRKLSINRLEQGNLRELGSDEQFELDR